MTSGDDIPEQAYEDLRALYGRVDAIPDSTQVKCRMDGACCCFDTSGLRLFASALERRYLVREAGPPPRGESGGRCPYLADRICTARTGRTLGCRLYFCDPLDEEGRNHRYEAFHREIKALHRKYDLPYDYRDILDVCAECSTGKDDRID